MPRWLQEGNCKLSLNYELRGETSCGRSTCHELTGSISPDRRVTLFIDVANHALRKVTWRSTLPLEPIPDHLVKDIPADRKQTVLLALEAGRPVDEEETLEIEPIFDQPLEAGAFDFESPKSSPP